MHELGNVQKTAQGTRALTPPGKEPPNPKQKTVTTKIEYDDAAAAVINSRQIQVNRYNDAPLLESLQAVTASKTKKIKATSQSSRFHIYSDPSKMRVKLANEIKAINSFEGFLLGVHEKIEKFSRHTQFGLEQILDVEKYKAELYESLELYKFTLRRIKAEAFKALQCQGNLGPQRVLQLLKETIAKQNTAVQVK